MVADPADGRRAMTARTPPATPDIARAERQGYAAYINGRHPDIDGCPYPVGPLREAWIRGFKVSAASPPAERSWVSIGDVA